MDTPRLADNITVTRDPGTGAFTVAVDGVPLPFAVAGDEGAVTTTAVGQLPAVRVTILAKTVTVTDRAYEGQDLEHGHAEG